MRHVELARKHHRTDKGRHAARAHADVRRERIRCRHHGAAAHDEVVAHRAPPIRIRQLDAHEQRDLVVVT